MKMTIQSDYALSCGSVQTKEWDYAKVELYKEHNTYHVRRFSDFVDGRKVQEAWLCFDTLKEARRAFKRQCEIVQSR